MEEYMRALSTSYLVQSYAKINLTLDVLGKRPDGYHELATIMQTINLYDTIRLTISDDDRVHIICTQPGLATSDNLAVRAAQAVRQQLSLKQGLCIELHKRIPVAAGLGGGSSAAAAVLLSLQEWWQLSLSPTDLLALAASLGSDVPFFLTGGLALCEGRGERVTPLAPHWPAAMNWLLLLKPAVSVSTASVYRALSARDYTDGTATRTVCEALQAGRAFPLEAMHNSLERGVLESYPEIARARTDLLRAGAPVVRLSGSGSILFAPFSSLEDAWQAHQSLCTQGYEVYLTHAFHQ
jgi:4-diphosphocytidyl-2-C-methyl-D-erythritol kinase